MKTSDVQMTKEELATLQGLSQSYDDVSGLGQIADDRAARMAANKAARMAQFSAGSSALALQAQLGAPAALQQTMQAIAQQQQPQQEPGMFDSLPDWMKSPWYWAGVALVVGGGIWWWMRRNKSVRQVAAVETLGLAEMKPKRKRRRKSRKSKK